MPDLSQEIAALRPVVFAFVRKRVANDADAQDLAQDILAAATLKQAQLNNAENLKAWLFGMARNRVIDHYRAEASRHAGQSAHARELAVDSQAGEAHNEDPGDAGHCLRAILLAMPQEYRQAVQLADVDGESMREIADLLKLSVPGAKSRVQRGRKMLRDGLTECCELEFDSFGAVAAAAHRDHDCRFCNLVAKKNS